MNSFQRQRKLFNEKVNSFILKPLPRLGLFLAIVSPVAFLSVYGYQQVKRDLTTIVLHRYENMNHLSALALEERMDRLLDIGILLSDRPLLRATTDLKLWDTAMQIVKTVPQELPYVNRILLLDQQGALKGQLPGHELEIDTDMSKEVWFKEVKGKVEPYISTVYRKSGQLPHGNFIVSIPIRDEYKKLIGVLVVEVRADKLMNLSEAVALNPHRSVFFVDKEGTLAAHSRNVSPEDIAIFPTLDVVRRTLKGERGIQVDYNPIQKEESVTAFEPTTENGWGVITREPTRFAFKQRNETLRFILFLYGLLLFLTSLLALFILQVLENLQKTQEELSESQEELKEYLNHMTTFSAKISPTGQLLFVNRAAEKGFGVPLQDLYKLNFLEGPWWSFDKKVQDRVRENFEKALSGQSINYDEKILLNGNKITFINFGLTPVFDKEENVSYILAEGRDISLLKFTEKALAKAQKEAQLVNWEWDSNLLKFKNSDQLCEFFGWSIDDPINSPEFLLSKLDPQDRDSIKSKISTSIKEQGSFGFDCLLKHDENNSQWVHIMGAPSYNDAGNLISFIGTIQDISERKNAESQREQLIREQEKRSQAEKSGHRSDFLAQASLLLSSSLDYEETLRRLARLLMTQFSDWGAIYLREPNGSVYRKVISHSGLSGHDFEKIKSYSVVPADPNHPMVKVMRSGKAELIKDVPQNELQRFSMDKDHADLVKEFGYQSAMFVPLIARGTALGAIEFVSGHQGRKFGEEDIVFADELAHYASIAIENAFLHTQALETKGILKGREEELADLFETASIGLHLLGSNGLIIKANKAELEMLGYRKDEYVGQSILKFHKDESVIKDFLTRLHRNEKIEDFEAQLICKDGSIKDVLISANVLWKDGQFNHARCFTRDITMAKRTEKALRESEQQFRQMADAALESARAKSEFVSNVSHEIRTPMNGIIGMTGLLMDTNLSDKQKDFAQTIKKSCDELLTIINDILDFSKIESGKMVLEIQDFDLTSTIETTAELLAARAHQKGLELIPIIPHDIPSALRGDPARFRQILNNFVSNAIKFTETGEVLIRVSKDAETESHVTLTFSVIDTGIGVPPNRQGHLFQPFIQSDPSTTRKFGGTGLGLAISKRIVELMGGEVGLKSEPEKGSTFWCRVCFEKQVHPHQRREKREDISALHVMVIAQNPHEREGILEKIKSLKIHQFATAADGDDAVKILNQKPPDHFHAVILDCPLQEGIQLAQKIKSMSAGSKSKFLHLIHVNDSLDIAGAENNGRTSYVFKPLQRSALTNFLLDQNLQSLRDWPEDNQSQKPKPFFKKSRILIVEDNSVNQKVMLLQLENMGCKADAVGNGLEALRALEQVSYDLVLMDCQMPEMDGYTATRLFRKRSKKSKHTPIIAMTANVMSGDREKCLAAGMDDYISKPIRMDMLESLLTKWLGERNLQQSSPDAKNNPLNDPKFIEEVSALFLKETAGTIKSMEQAIKKNKRSDLKIMAHAMAGSCCIVGTNDLKEAARKIEYGAPVETQAELKKYLKDLSLEFAIVKKILKPKKGRNHNESTRR